MDSESQTRSSFERFASTTRFISSSPHPPTCFGDNVNHNCAVAEENHPEKGKKKTESRQANLGVSHETITIGDEIITIAHKKITELIPKQFRFGNSSTKITE